MQSTALGRTPLPSPPHKLCSPDGRLYRRLDQLKAQPQIDHLILKVYVDSSRLFSMIYRNDGIFIGLQESVHDSYFSIEVIIGR